MEKFDGRRKRRSRPPRLSDTRECEGPQLLAIEVEPEKIPLVIDTTEMIGPNTAGFGRGAPQFSITKLNLD